MGYRLDPATLRHLWPRAPQAKIDSICKISAEVFDEFGIGDDHRVIAQLMANISHENGAGTIVRESGHYRPDRLVEVFGSPHSSAGVTHEEAQYLCHDEKALFERVYNLPRSPKLAHELGNHLPGDGYKYRGGGDLQLTGRGSYEHIGHLTGHVEIIDNPDALVFPEISFRVACAEFAALGAIGPAKNRNTTLVRRKVNGGTNGLSEVAVWVRKWEEALPEIEAKAWVPRGADTGNKTLADSTILKGLSGTAVATGGGVLSQVGTITQQASDTIGTVQETTDSINSVTQAAPAVVHAAQTFLGLMPQVWLGIGIACGVLALAGCAYIGWRRYLKYRDEGV
jgi:putative chitinase